MIPLVKFVLKKSISQDLLTLRNRLKRENTLYLNSVLARNILLTRRIFWCFKILSVNVCLHACRHSLLIHVIVIMQRQRHHEMNMSASVCVSITSKPAISHFYSFVLSFITPVGE